MDELNGFRKDIEEINDEIGMLNKDLDMFTKEMDNFSKEIARYVRDLRRCKFIGLIVAGSLTILYVTLLILFLTLK